LIGGLTSAAPGAVSLVLETSALHRVTERYRGRARPANA
jgi:hypothetical protein